MTDFASSVSSIQPVSTPLSGLAFNFAYGAGVPLNQVNTVANSANQVGAEWSRYLKDDALLNIRIDFVDLLDPVVSGARPAMVKVNYKDFVGALFDDQTSQTDELVLNNLQLSAKDQDTLLRYADGALDRNKVKFDSKSFDLLLDSEFAPSSKSRQQEFFLDNNGNDNNQKIWLTRANAKALGLVRGDDKKLDAVIEMNWAVAWDFDPSDGIDPGAYDFHSVLLHEIGHALGVVSGVDAFEFLTLTQNKTLSDKDLTYVTPMDLFRYSPESARKGVMDLRIGGAIQKFFSLDGGKTMLAEFSTGGTNLGGDGYQASHWKFVDQPLGVMHPNLQPGQSLQVSDLDLTLLDAMGWDLEVPLNPKAAAIGLDWNQLKQGLSEHQQTVMDNLATQWETKNPGYSIQSDLESEATRLNFKLNQAVDKELDRLAKKIDSLKDFSKRDQEIQRSIDKIWKLQDKHDQELAKYVKEREDLGGNVRRWLNLDNKKLAEALDSASAIELQKLSDLLNKSTITQRVFWEIKLLDAFTYLTDKPQKAVEELMKTTGPGNPVGWRGARFWRYFQTGEDASLDMLFQATDSLDASSKNKASSDPFEPLSDLIVS